MSNSIVPESGLADTGFVNPPGGPIAWLVCLSAGLFFFYEFFQLNLFDVINQPLRDSFHLDAAELSWMSSSYLLADLLFLLPAGVILDRYSPRKVILLSMFVCVLGTLGFALTSSFWLAFIFHFLSGIGNAFCFLSCVVLVSRWFPPRKQATAVGSLVTMAFLGGMMAHTPLAYLAERFGWRQSLLIDAAVGLILLLWIALVVRDEPKCRLSQKPFSHHVPGPRFLAAIKNPQNWFAGLYTSCLNLPIMVLCALWGATYLEVVHHLSQIAASSVVSMIFIGSILACPVVGWISDNMGRRKPLMYWGGILTLLTLIPLLTGWVLSEWTLSIIFFLLGVFTSTQVITYPVVAESNPMENTGAATGIASVIIMAGGAIAQVLFGKLMEQHHASSHLLSYSMSDFQYAMWMFPVATFVALLALMFTRETFCKRMK